MNIGSLIVFEVVVSESKQDVLIAPSILGADLSRIGEEARLIQDSGADLIHIDVMDGHFVPNLTFGSGVVAAINRSVDIFLEVHAMVYNPFDFIESFVSSGADRIIVHFEATEDVEAILKYIKKCGVQAGLAFSPETSLDFIPKFIPFCDVVLLMSVHPGFCGQKFIPETIDKIRYVKQCIKNCFKDNIEKCLLEVDGGVDNTNARLCLEAGADILVAASYLFKQESSSMKDKIALLRDKGVSTHGIK